VSGLSVVVDAGKAPGSRVQSVMVNGKQLDPSATYKVATNDYMVGGGDGYTALGSGKVLIDASAADLMATDVMNYVQQKGTISPAPEGRITINK
ncbi:MAG TPA: 5'-nucleotidase, partial [Alphaproteobacteria bacterium]|nr:5'-nucleotidase [Alphaproteobacteria bacterium]